MKRSLRLSVLTVVLLAVAVGIWYALIASGVGGCGRRSLDTNIAQRLVYEDPAGGAAAEFAPVEDWPKWRGPRGDGISRETDLADKWPDGGPRRLWEADVGLGYSSPVAVGGRVYLCSLNDGKEALTCFDARSGRILWNQEEGGGWGKDYPGTRATPAIDVQRNRIYTYGGTGDLVCRDLANGNAVWRLNVLKQTGSGNLGWGTASSPLLANGLVYVQSGEGGAVAVAVNADSGSVVWQSEMRGKGSYAHPVLIEVPGGKSTQLVVFAGEALVGMDPQTGKTLWSEPWATNYAVNAATPVYDGRGNLFASSEYGMGGLMVTVAPDGLAKRQWANKEVKSKFPQMILDGGVLYANSEGRLKAMSWPDGKRKWSEDFDLGAGGSLVRADGDKLILLSAAGTLRLVRATPEGVELLSEAEVFEGSQVWATPLVYGGRLYAKGETELVCFDISDSAAGAPATAATKTATTRE